MEDQEILELTAQIMTSGMPQTGATFNLPESMLMDLARKCYTRGYQRALDRVSEGFVPFVQPGLTPPLQK